VFATLSIISETSPRIYSWVVDTLPPFSVLLSHFSFGNDEEEKGRPASGRVEASRRVAASGRG